MTGQMDLTARGVATYLTALGLAGSENQACDPSRGVLSRTTDGLILGTTDGLFTQPVMNRFQVQVRP